MWVFRRKSRRKRLRSSLSDADDAGRGQAAQKPNTGRRQTAPVTMVTDTGPDQGQPPENRRGRPHKLQRRVRNYSFSPGRNDAIRVDRKRSPRRTHGSGSISEAVVSGRNEVGEGAIIPVAAATIGADTDPRIPTLHSKRDGDHLLPRKKSSKRRRKNDQTRAAEIKAMGSFMPLRPATDAHTAGRPMKKDSRRIRLGFTFPFSRSDWDKDNRSSEISLPIPESIHSSLSSDSEHISFKVSALDALAPRPTIRYAVSPKGVVTPRKLSDRAPYPEATLKAHKRIDDLANDLSASDLRELMERDQRRKERKRLTDQEKIERRLARKAEKQRTAEAHARAVGGEPPSNLERGVLGRELVGLGIDATSAVVTSSRRRSSIPPPRSPAQSTDQNKGEQVDASAKPSPLDAFHRNSSIPVSTHALPQHETEPVPPLASSKAQRQWRASKSRSKSPQPSDGTGDAAVKVRKGSMPWASIFRWGAKYKRANEPSSFSNTSRDSMRDSVHAVQHPVLPPTLALHRKASTNMPKRTRSRFREDLPELPLSPPESRTQSPNSTPTKPAVAKQTPIKDRVDEMQLSSPTVHQMARYDTPTSGHRSLESMQQTPTSWTRQDEMQPSPAPPSMSLASIDSEGSWLSGRLAGKARSSGLPESLSRMRDHHEDTSGDSDATIGSRDYENLTVGEDHSIADDEYLSRYTPISAAETRWKRKSTGEARPSSDEEDARWGAVRGQQPNVVHEHMADKIKSREGLLNAFGDDDPSDADEFDDHETEGSTVQRATSISLKNPHARHISAGSARLLQLTPRSSVDTKRNSITNA